MRFTSMSGCSEPKMQTSEAMCITAALGAMPWRPAVQLLGIWSSNQFVTNSALATLARKERMFGGSWPFSTPFRGVSERARNPEAVQEHLCKCFDAISRVTFTEAGSHVVLGSSIRSDLGSLGEEEGHHRHERHDQREGAGDLN